VEYELSTVSDSVASNCDLSTLEDEARAALCESQALLRRISELYCILADQPDPESDEERELRELITQRRALATRLGQALMRIVARGARVTFEVSEEPLVEAARPRPAPEPPPEPATPSLPPTRTHTPARAPAASDIDDEKPNTPIVPEAMPSSAELSHTTAPPGRTQVKPPRIADSEPADPASLIALAQLGLTPQWSQRRTHTARRRSLDDLVQAIGRPTRLQSRDDVAAAVQRLTGGIARMDAWLDQSQEAQKALMGLISSLARQIQDESDFGLDFAEDEALRSAFSRMTAWSREHRPGFVPGLSRSNPPDHGSWFDDYRHWYQMLQPPPARRDAVTSAEGALGSLQRALEEGVSEPEELVKLARGAIESGLSQSDPRLVTMLTPFQSHLQGARGLKTLKNALRDALNAEEQDVHQADQADPIPEGWPLLELTEGKHAVILGGDPRPAAIERIHTAFRLRNLEWEESDVRRVRALAERIRRRSVDLVIVLRRFISHREHDIVRPACQEAGVPICVVDTGYGVTQIRLAMERYWGAMVSD